MNNIDSLIENKDIPIFKKQNDVFKRELKIISVHYSYSIHRKTPIDILYKSNPSGERVFLILDSKSKFILCDNITKSKFILCDNIILNIDGKKNIKVEKKYAHLDEERFEMTKEQLYELCKASSLALQVNGQKGVIWEGEVSGFITVLQALYNEVLDNTLFLDAKDKIWSYWEEEKKKENRKWEEEKKKENRKRLWGIFLLVVGLLIVFSPLLLLIRKPFFKSLLDKLDGGYILIYWIVGVILIVISSFFLREE